MERKSSSAQTAKSFHKDDDNRNNICFFLYLFLYFPLSSSQSIILCEVLIIRRIHANQSFHSSYYNVSINYLTSEVDTI